ncbi:MAG: TlpA family protein disulfide reductase [Lachnospiraceae bacterium]|nr:TlpA family protein disulfide reductase [Lachnospiraceae bacterium]
MKRGMEQQRGTVTKTIIAMAVTLALLVGCGSAAPAASTSSASDAAASASSASGNEASTSSASENPDATEAATAETADATENPDAQPAPDFVLTDQYGNTQSLAQYRGKVVFLNFWATWCPPCRAEMPDIQKLYEEYSAQGDAAEVVILGVAGPGNVDDQDLDGVKAFLEENGYTYPVAMDMTGELFNTYYITAYPTTFMIDKNGSVFGYVQGSLTEDVMRDIIEQTLSGQMRNN